ncbi:septation ring formation regulator [Terribacillus aidingensis]|uniref:Septation ring formation regulator EzrA n=1 Tax=Terribacillus aidingensis TaxID=586416 RepID=A0A285P8N6_9BACI|nr:septation ring formation regulator EzrA [Terribacillus aidingensis]SNZ18084.1 septation ring formation regulator [Terribacillus aidingensis]
MPYIIGGIIVIIALIILGLIMRKRVYDEVDRLESWKLDITNRNVSEELAKVKALNLSGETQEKFESWKERWDHIVTKELPDTEEALFDAEEGADRYRFKKAKQHLQQVQDILIQVEDKIEVMFRELDHLLASEEEARKQAEELQPTLQGLKRTISQHRHQFGKADVRFESAIAEQIAQLAAYHALIESGNYFEANQLIMDVKEKTEVLAAEIEAFPTAYKQVKQDLPAQISDLLGGIREMKQDGYRIHHLGFEDELKKENERLGHLTQQLESGNSEETKLVIPALESRIKEMYQLLENEAVAKNYVDSKFDQYVQAVEKKSEAFLVTKEEVDLLRESYFFTDNDVEFHVKLESKISRLALQLDNLQKEIDDDQFSHAKLKEELEAGFRELSAIEEEHEVIREKIKTLRKDELDAKEKIADMRQKLYEVNRKLQKSNIPGVPQEVWKMVEESQKKTSHAMEILDGHPLDMAEVSTTLQQAEEVSNATVEKIEILLEQAYLAEVVIQYSNRYRSQYPMLAAEMLEAEKLFREYQYEQALERAARALQDIEPKALERLEKHIKVPS